MILRSVVRPCVLGLTVMAAGCSILESINANFQDAPFEEKMAGDMATAPVFRTGDIYRFRVGKNLIMETVEKITAEGVWWRDSVGRRWVGGESALIPSRSVLKINNTPTIADADMETTGEMFPLIPGKTVAYRYTIQDGFGTGRTHERSCTVGDFGTVKTVAGAFDVYRLKCVYDGIVRNNYYAPELGRVVLQTSNTIFDTVKRELVSFGRASAASKQSAEVETSMPLAPASKPLPVKSVSMPPPAKLARPPVQVARGAPDRYVVQLAAYRSPTRAKRAWPRIQRAGGALFNGHTPDVERHKGPRGLLFRLTVGAYKTQNQARDYCRNLKRRGVDCWPRARMAAN